ncbi:MAG: hypothetical protein V7K43_28025 [Nostoc sp.]
MVKILGESPKSEIPCWSLLLIVVKHIENKAFESQYSSPLLRDRGSENSDSYKKPELGLAQ